MFEQYINIVSTDHANLCSKPIRKIIEEGFRSKIVNGVIINNKTQNTLIYIKRATYFPDLRGDINVILINNSWRYHGK